MWWVGNGLNIKVWEDTWLSGCPPMKISILNLNIHGKVTLLRKTWQDEVWGKMFQEAPLTSFVEVLNWVMEHMWKGLYGFITSCWVVWTCRNKAIFEQSEPKVELIRAGFQCYVEDYQKYATNVYSAPS
ncbi:unnamed protein product [Cuscuta epithymum]|uniref:Reverse transcriptase zinc-binding domain-containing protein n=1 Tax=Cuscuta epithymum TaxID=186058 RepID=A0AAV0ERQ2_9ASTE|nr:unnamed protein product [Cuscuta epithymum]